jgi:SAM-dependent methyltransferase
MSLDSCILEIVEANILDRILKMKKNEDSNFQEYFTQYATEWTTSAHDGTYGYYPLANKRKEKAIALIEEFSDNRGNAVDFGSGPGLFAQSLSEIGFNVTGIDFSTAMVEHAIQNSTTNPKVSFIHSDWMSFSKNVDSNSLDLVSALGFIYYLEDISVFASEMFRVLRPGCHFVVSFRNAGFSRSLDLFEEQLAHYSLQEEISRRFFLESLILGMSNGIPRIDGLKNMPQLTLPRHLETDVTDLFATVGLKKIKSVGLHPHLLHPGLNNDEMVGLGDILSLPLDAVPDAPLNWFSHFVTIFEKSPNS